jgi:hypothetical protein
VAVDGVSIGNWIYWALKHVITNNYDTNDHSNYSTHEVFSVFTGRCLVAASNSGRSYSSGFPNCLDIDDRKMLRIIDESSQWRRKTSEKSGYLL